MINHDCEEEEFDDASCDEKHPEIMLLSGFSTTAGERTMTSGLSSPHISTEPPFSPPSRDLEDRLLSPLSPCVECVDFEGRRFSGQSDHSAEPVAGADNTTAKNGESHKISITRSEDRESTMSTVTLPLCDALQALTVIVHGRLKRISSEVDGEETFPDSPGVERLDTSASLWELSSLTTIDSKTFLRVHNRRSAQMGNNVHDRYHLEEILGEGAYGSVWAARERMYCDAGKAYGRSVAIKKLPHCEDIYREVLVLKTVDHPSVARLFEVFDDGKNMYMVLEKCDGGELLDRIMDSVGSFAEDDAKRIMHQVASALTYCHRRNIIHRDIKPDNILFCSPWSDANDMWVKLVDFGLALGSTDSTQRNRTGTDLYSAPELHSNQVPHITAAADMWAIGCVLFSLLSGGVPFSGVNAHEAIKRGTFSLDMECGVWQEISLPCKEAIRGLMHTNPDERWTAEEFLNSQWLSGCKPHYNAQHEVSPVCNPIPELQMNSMVDQVNHLCAFAEKSLFRRVCLSVVARQMEWSQCARFTETFCTMDVDGDGLISMSDWDKVWNAVVPEDQQVQGECMMIFTALNLSASGAIEFSEYLAACIDQRVLEEDSLLWSAFTFFGGSMDGTLKFSSLQACVRGVIGNAESVDVVVCGEDYLSLGADTGITFRDFKMMLREGNDVTESTTPDNQSAENTQRYVTWNEFVERRGNSIKSGDGVSVLPKPIPMRKSTISPSKNDLVDLHDEFREADEKSESTLLTDARVSKDTIGTLVNGKLSLPGLLPYQSILRKSNNNGRDSRWTGNDGLSVDTREKKTINSELALPIGRLNRMDTRETCTSGLKRDTGKTDNTGLSIPNRRSHISGKTAESGGGLSLPIGRSQGTGKTEESGPFNRSQGTGLTIPIDRRGTRDTEETTGNGLALPIFSRQTQDSKKTLTEKPDSKLRDTGNLSHAFPSRDTDKTMGSLALPIIGRSDARDTSKTAGIALPIGRVDSRATGKTGNSGLELPIGRFGSRDTGKTGHSDLALPIIDRKNTAQTTLTLPIGGRQDKPEARTALERSFSKIFSEELEAHVQDKPLTVEGLSIGRAPESSKLVEDSPKLDERKNTTASSPSVSPFSGRIGAVRGVAILPAKTNLVSPRSHRKAQLIEDEPRKSSPSKLPDRTTSTSLRTAKSGPASTASVALRKIRAQAISQTSQPVVFDYMIPEGADDTPDNGVLATGRNNGGTGSCSVLGRSKQSRSIRPILMDSVSMSSIHAKTSEKASEFSGTPRSPISPTPNSITSSSSPTKHRKTTATVLMSSSHTKKRDFDYYGNPLEIRDSPRWAKPTEDNR